MSYAEGGNTVTARTSSEPWATSRAAADVHYSDRPSCRCSCGVLYIAVGNLRMFNSGFIVCQ